MARPILVLFVVLAAVLPGQSPRLPRDVRDIDGVAHDLLVSSTSTILIFVASDCPISNGYAPEIQRLCVRYREKSVACKLVYEDGAIDATAVRRHLAAFGYRDIPALIDKEHTIAAAVAATVTPQAVVISGGQVRYSGRLDNRYEALGKLRRVVTVHDLRDALDSLVTGRPIARPSTKAVGCFIPVDTARSPER